MRHVIWLVVASCILGAACAPKANRFVLVPDREGHVGTVHVSNAKGSAVLDQPQQSVLVRSAAAAPSRPEILSPSVVQALFGDALAAEPPAPLVCIIYFATGSSEVDPVSEPELAKAIAEIARRESRDISVDGHTDTTGARDTNMRLSLERARSVRDRLVRAGVPADAIAVGYHGRGNLLVPTGDNVDEPRNRRVQVIVR